MIQNRSRIYFGKIIVFLAFSLSEIFGQNTTSKKQKSLEIEPTVVTVSAEALPLSASSAAVTILTEEFIRGSHAGNMMDLLRQVPFLYLSQTGGRGGLTTVTIRGGDPNFTLVMVDGIPVNDPTNILGGSFDFSTLSVENIKQIEIVRGPMSALYGSESVGGVINIITRGGENEIFLLMEYSVILIPVRLDSGLEDPWNQETILWQGLTLMLMSRQKKMDYLWERCLSIHLYHWVKTSFSS